MKKLLYIVLDGLGDLPIKELGDLTPLEKARTPHLDSLAKRGITGLIHTVKKGIAPESDVAVISILGYDAHRYYTGRGPLESFAVGLKVNEGDLAWRVNFATLGNGKEIRDRRVGRNLTTDEATQLSAAINKEVKLTSCPATLEFKNTVGHRGVLVIKAKGKKLSAHISNVDPAYGKEGAFGVAKPTFENIFLECVPDEGFEDDEAAKMAARLTNEFVEKSHEVLDKHPVNKKRAAEGKLPGNLILARDAGNSLPKFPKLSELHGMKFASLVEMPVERGIATLTGMEIIELPLPTKDAARDYPLRVEKVLKAMNNFDALYIHLKGPDEPAHDGDFAEKMKTIEEIDKYFFEKLLPAINLKETIVAVTSDHSTPCALKAHSPDPPPALVVGGNIESDGSTAFGEGVARSGKLGEIIGPEFMPILARYCRE